MRVKGIGGSGVMVRRIWASGRRTRVLIKLLLIYNHEKLKSVWQGARVELIMCMELDSSSSRLTRN